MNDNPIDKIIEDKVVENTITAYLSSFNIPLQKTLRDELRQMIYLALLEKQLKSEEDAEEIARMVEDDTIGYWVWQAVKKQVSSKKSKFYGLFRLYYHRNITNEINNNGKDGRGDEDNHYRRV